MGFGDIKKKKILEVEDVPVRKRPLPYGGELIGKTIAGITYGQKDVEEDADDEEDNEELEEEEEVEEETEDKEYDEKPGITIGIIVFVVAVAYFVLRAIGVI